MALAPISPRRPDYDNGDTTRLPATNVRVRLAAAQARINLASVDALPALAAKNSVSSVTHQLLFLFLKVIGFNF